MTKIFNKVAELSKFIYVLVLVAFARLFSFITKRVNVEVKVIQYFNKFFPKPQIGGRKGPEDYFLWQYSTGQKIYNYFKKGELSFKGKTVLDLGCGRGGKTAFYKAEGASNVIGIDLRSDALKIASEMTKKHGVDSVGFILGNALRLPFKENFFDIIIMNDMVEHVPSSEMKKIFKEASRVINPDGFIILDFSPYHNPRGSHLYDFVYTPYCHLLFSKKALIEYCKQQSATPYVIKQFDELNRITKKQFYNIFTDAGLKIREMKVYRSSFFLKNVPILENLFINKIFCLLSK